MTLKNQQTIVNVDGTVAEIPVEQMKRALQVVKLSVKPPFPANSALQRIGLQVRAAYKDYQRQTRYFNTAARNHRKALKAKDEEDVALFGHHMLHTMHIRLVNAQRVLVLCLLLEQLMSYMMDGLEREQFGEILSD